MSSGTTFGRDVLGDYELSKSKEWLLTNGLGGYASSTVTGANSRGYHGLLVASIPPGLTRVLLLSKVEDEARTSEGAFPLSTNHYPGAVYPHGFMYLQGFDLLPCPTWRYSFGGTIIRKAVRMPQGVNAVEVSYSIEDGPGPVELTVKPMVNHRGFHDRTKEDSGLSFTQVVSGASVRVDSSAGSPSLFLRCDSGSYEEKGEWYRNMLYDEEELRGYPFSEDHFSPGTFRALLEVGRGMALTASVEPTAAFPDEPPQAPGVGGYKPRFDVPISLLALLTLASRQFVVTPPGSEDRTVVAGYHWFGEYGRDAAVSLPGLLLATGREGDARAVMKRFFKRQRGGLLPVLLNGEECSWASVDTSLFFVNAVKKYYDSTGDASFLKEVWGGLASTMGSYMKGTDFGIRMADDGLIEANTEELPLTWMDATVGGAPAVRRLSKCIEINALWYNALRAMEALAQAAGAKGGYLELAKRVKESFNGAFWNAEGGYLYDSVGGGKRDGSIRPNQIFSISLPYPVLERQRWNRVLYVVQEHLYTPFGLRSLSRADPGYRGIYAGGPPQRDTAYHNGTVWSWLAGPYISAACKARSGQRDLLIRRMLDAFLGHINDAGLGSVSEIFDGDAPHHPRGCIAQAWSVAELLRSYEEDLRKARAPVQ
ncbi:MAG: amylo-alpha-1,6-glucosidase [Conexivisphaerales archaeon]